MRKGKRFIVFAIMILAITWAASAFAEDIVIGYSGPLSGPAAEYGQDCLNGIDMAVNEINAKGGITVRGQGYTFRLERMDDRVDPKISANNASQLRKQHKAIAIFNPVFSTIASMMKINEERKNEFLIMAYTSMPNISEMGNKLLVAIPMPFNVFISVYAGLAWDKGWRKGAMVVTAGPYGDEWRKTFKEEWTKKGGTITADKPANYYTKTDFTGPLAAALETNPDFLLIGGPSSTTVMIVEQARARGFEGGFVLIDQAKLDAIVQVMEKPLLLEGSIGLAMVKDVPFPASSAFSSNYAASYKRTLTWESVVHYTAMYALAKAIVSAGTADDVRAIRAALPKVLPMLGDKYPMEYFGITSNGRMLAASVVQTMRHGKFTQPKILVWWPKTQKEFDQVRKVTKLGIPMTWKRIND